MYQTYQSRNHASGKPLFIVSMRSRAWRSGTQTLNPNPPPPCRRHLRVVDCRSFLRHKQHRLLSARLQTEREAEPPQVPAVAASALLAGPSEDLRVGMSDVCRVEVGFRNLVVCRPIFALLLSKDERADVSRNFGCS